ncbi:MAG: ABC transporter ATP-binding protein, partial [Pseudomonadota bacterium]
MATADPSEDAVPQPTTATQRKGWPFAWFERLVDPYVAYDERTPPPARLFDFYREMLRPVRWIVGLSAALALVVAVLDALLIAFAGRIVDILTSTTPERLWADHGGELLGMAAVAFILRPVVIGVERLLMGQGFFPSMGAIIRWRTHRHMLRQSVGFFNDDFAGRIANKQIQLAPAFNDTVFNFLDAVWYALVYVAAAAVIFGDTDARLLLPLGIWFALYIATACWFVPRVTRVGMMVAEARSRLAGRIVDSYTNILTVKLFAHAHREDLYARDAIEDMRWVFAEQTRLFTKLEMIMTVVNAALIGGTLGYGVYLWTGGDVTVGAIAAASALVLRLQAMTDWIMWTLSMLFQNIGTVQEGVETVSQPHRLQDAPGAPALRVSNGAVRFDGVSHHYGREAGREIDATEADEAPSRPRGAGVNGIDLEIQGGERVGLVGPSGAGKST